MFGFGKPKCPVDLLTAEWQEARFEWLGRVLGGDDPAQPVVVEPTSSFFPWRLDSEEGARRAFEAVCTHMGVDPESVVLEFQDGTKQARENFSKLGQWESDAPGGTWDDQGPHRIVISRDAFGDAMYFVYVAAHELGHQGARLPHAKFRQRYLISALFASRARNRIQLDDAGSLCKYR